MKFGFRRARERGATRKSCWSESTHPPPPPPPPTHTHTEGESVGAIVGLAKGTRAKPRFPAPARFGYATEGALFISAQLSTDAVSALRKWGLTVEATWHPRKHETHPPRVKKRSSVSIQTILVLSELAEATWSFIKQTSDIIWVVCYKLTAVWASSKNCSLTDSFSRPMA